MSDKAGIYLGSDGARSLSEKELLRHERQSGMIELGLCPNGCGPMVQTDEHNDDCPKCKFHYFRNVPRSIRQVPSAVYMGKGEFSP